MQVNYWNTGNIIVCEERNYLIFSWLLLYLSHHLFWAAQLFDFNPGSLHTFSLLHNLLLQSMNYSTHCSLDVKLARCTEWDTTNLHLWSGAMLAAVENMVCLYVLLQYPTRPPDHLLHEQLWRRSISHDFLSSNINLSFFMSMAYPCDVYNYKWVSLYIGFLYSYKL